jgi:hypothetical protein
VQPILPAFRPHSWQWEVLMLDENIDYAQRLMRADVPTELHV